jgi:hypothetical protein
MSLLFQQPPPCVKCGSTTVVAPHWRRANGLSWFDAQRASVPVHTRSSIAPYGSGEPDHGTPRLAASQMEPKVTSGRLVVFNLCDRRFDTRKDV